MSEANNTAPVIQNPAPAAPGKAVPTAPAVPVLSVKLLGKSRTGEPVTLEVTVTAQPGMVQFADAMGDWGDGAKDDHARLFRRGDQLVGRMSHTYAKAGTYPFTVASDLAGGRETATTPINCEG